MAHKWYAIQTHGGSEMSVKRAMEMIFEQMGIPEKLGDILVPTEDVIEVKEKSRDIPQIKEGIELAQKRGVPSWLELDAENFKGVVKAEPTREEIEIPVEEHLIVELYSK